MNIEIAPKETEIKDTWDNAVIYCQFLEVAATTGWRLPTLDELKEIYHSENDFVGSFYWSSTERDGNDSWGQHFSNGCQYYGGRAYIYRVRAVRDM